MAGTQENLGKDGNQGGGDTVTMKHPLREHPAEVRVDFVELAEQQGYVRVDQAVKEP
ncbi:hypothetical protein JW766_02185 [Candidatus Dojkabacteria bacterium]|nr:hypothetical protein [Candidatus Dojkabacteria bacterium]